MALARTRREPGDGPRTAVEQVRQFDSFYRSEYRGVLMILAGLVDSRAVAEELTQDAFLRTHRRWASVARHPNPEAWVRRVAINLSMSWLRRRRAEARAVMRLSGRPREWDELPAPMMDWWKAVRSLPKRQAQCVCLFYAADMSVADIAETLVLAQGTVKAHLYQGRKALAAALSLDEEAPA